MNLKCQITIHEYIFLLKYPIKLSIAFHYRELNGKGMTIGNMAF